MDVNVSLINDLVERMQELEKERNNFLYDYIRRNNVYVRIGIKISDEMADRIRGWAFDAYNAKSLIEYVPYHINPEKDWA